MMVREGERDGGRPSERWQPASSRSPAGATLPGEGQHAHNRGGIGSHTRSEKKIKGLPPQKKGFLRAPSTLDPLAARRSPWVSAPSCCRRFATAAAKRRSPATLLETM